MIGTNLNLIADSGATFGDSAYHLAIFRVSPYALRVDFGSTSPSLKRLDKMASRLYIKGRILGHKRGKRNSRPNQSLLQIEGVDNKEAARHYLGKRVAYVYKAKREINGSRVRVIWGRISRSHGNSGAVKSKFRTNLPAKTFGASCRIMLFPSNI
ncbi:50S small subunit ribosomal protein L33-b [Cryptococcus bacillisporus CA1873]|uniref:Unplaced genomic scaffold supercont1.16, whole genome shotgun sequence n=4 Tax=Cryptococcus gattii species complex TaxID=1884637 RepID=A0A0D0VKP9_CRYGA|nr:50S small subunit ribosomal protein L33-b [Cryptococcus bacillisporus CA1280]KIR64045.1 50S small subunit ribosomal protein L33-b [Cryptococcus bacillisporus CA1873]|eukprot:KIR64045.1 50S small subunit ribosomal protein L33-b [Cryptococcus gattii CA1873]